MAWTEDKRIAKMIARRNILLTMEKEGVLKPGDKYYLQTIQNELKNEEQMAHIGNINEN